jgi:hypothetical protein
MLNIRIDDCPLLDDEVVLAIAKHCSLLEVIHFVQLHAHNRQRPA